MESQLQAAFHLDSEDMKKLKKEWREIARKHIEFTLTVKQQRKEAWEAIERELTENFVEFQEEPAGTVLLQLAIVYLHTYFKDQISHRKKEVGENNHRATVKVKDEEETMHAPAITAPATEIQIAPGIKDFLESFTPSLAYLQNTFVNAKFSRDVVADWSRPRLADFLENLKDDAGQRLKPVVVEALLLRLKPDYYGMQIDSD
ncbi:hypothetical protein B0H16DRAFT_1714930 [Mycena metata]|uniref:Uncharacterized protein n=1 Tax=Mycena metata TaxID=1033252 RepID=A0AAD7JTT7_9AGAR|nr:hypothetical protein B0H16DRAFT_1714930 [Mycena metata]